MNQLVTVTRAILLNVLIVLFSIGLGLGEYAVLEHVDSASYKIIFFFLLIVLYCNVMAKALVSLINTYDRR